MKIEDLKNDLPISLSAQLNSYIGRSDYETAALLAYFLNEASMRTTNDHLIEVYEDSAKALFRYVDNYDPTPYEANYEPASQSTVTPR
jgi:hypothetical protein